VADYSRERPAALVLGADGDDPGLFTCADAEGMHAPPLVVLTSCRSAGRWMRRGEDGGTHFGGAFLGAGAQGVVLSYVDVSYGATLELMRHFHRRLREHGDPPAVALFHARRELARSSRFPSVAQRGVVHVSGLGFDPLFTAPAPSTVPVATRSPWWLVAIVLVAVAAGGWLLLRARRDRAAAK